MFAKDYSVLVLPSPTVNRNGNAMTGNYPIMCSHADVSGQTHLTLLPPLTNSQLIDNDLKYKLNRYSFSSCSASEASIPTPAASPVPRVTSHVQMPDDGARSHVIGPGQPGEYTTMVPLAAADEGATSLPALNSTPSLSAASAQVQEKTHKLASKHLIRKESPKHHLEQPQTKIEQRRRYVCKVCSKAFTTSGHLARHNRIHTGEKNHICPFEGCNQRFSRHDNCIQHYRTHFKKKSAV